MTEAAVVWVSGLIAVLSLAAALLIGVASLRWRRELRDATDRAVQARDQQILALEQEIEFLRQMDSVRITQRYIATKNAIDDRVSRLRQERSANRDRETRIRAALEELALPPAGSDAERVSDELGRVNADSERLEEIVHDLRSMGTIQVEALQSELASRRRMAAELQGRLDRLRLDGEMRQAETERLTAERERLLRDMERIEQEMELTASVGPIVDAMLGITPDVRGILGRVEESLQESLSQIDEARASESVVDVLRLVRGGAEPGEPASDRAARAPAPSGSGRLGHARRDPDWPDGRRPLEPAASSPTAGEDERDHPASPDEDERDHSMSPTEDLAHEPAEEHAHHQLASESARGQT